MQPGDIMKVFVTPSTDTEFGAAIGALSALPADQKRAVANALDAYLGFRYNKKQFSAAKATAAHAPEMFKNDLMRAMALFYTVAQIKGADAHPFTRQVVRNYTRLTVKDKGNVRSLVRVIETSQNKLAPAAPPPRPPRKRFFKPGR